MPNIDLSIKDDNISIYELESDPVFDYDAQDEEVRAEIDRENQQFENKTLRPLMMSHFGLCPCRAQKVQERALTRARLMGARPDKPIMIGPEQQDLDMVQFGAIVGADQGVHKTVTLIITRCKDCGHMEFYGDLDPVMHLMANGTNVYMGEHASSMPDVDLSNAKIVSGNGSLEDRLPEELRGAEFILEDTETGELTAADDLAEALYGTPASSGGDNSLELENVTEESDEDDVPTCTGDSCDVTAILEAARNKKKENNSGIII